MSTYLPPFLMGMVAGLRSMTAPAAVSWAAWTGRLHLENSGLAFLGSEATRYILTILAIGGVDRGQAAEDAQPQGGCGVHSPDLDRGIERRRSRHGKPGSDRRPRGGRARQCSGGTRRLRFPDPAGKSHWREGSSNRPDRGRNRDSRRVRCERNSGEPTSHNRALGPVSRQFELRSASSARNRVLHDYVRE